MLFLTPQEEIPRDIRTDTKGTFNEMLRLFIINIYINNFRSVFVVSLTISSDVTHDSSLE